MDLVHVLATAYQNQHQALVIRCTEQEQHFQALLQAQQEDQQVLQSLIVLAGTPAAAPTVAAGFPTSPSPRWGLLTIWRPFGAVWVSCRGVGVARRAASSSANAAPVWRGPACGTAAAHQHHAGVNGPEIIQQAACWPHTPEQHYQWFYTLTMAGVSQLFAFAQQLYDTC